MTRTPWFERRFHFQLPPDNQHDVLVRLMGTPLRLRELCRGLDPAKARARRDGTWSIQENVGHLLDIEPKVSKTPGKTRAVNFFTVRTSDPNLPLLSLVDLPGYGYAKVS